MDVKLDKQSKIPVYLQIVDQLRAQIMCGALPSGSVLPSERGLAQMLEVHRNTLVYRLEKIKKLTGLDLREFDDAIVFKVALMVKKYLSNNPAKY